MSSDRPSTVQVTISASSCRWVPGSLPQPTNRIDRYRRGRVRSIDTPSRLVPPPAGSKDSQSTRRPRT
jgi:hypothetical protein